jgi:uncharacterized protein (TIGR03435 family)
MLLAPALFAQTFEVTSVRPSPARAGDAAYIKFNVDGARATYSNVTLKLLISIAYEINDDRITVSEGWMESALYDVDAKIPAGAGKEKIPAMMRSLLTERFALAVHHTSRSMPAYDLTIAKNGPKLKNAAADGSGANYILKGRVIGPQMSMEVLAGILSRHIDRPVKDKTGTGGLFDIRLNWTPEGASGDDPSIYTALQEQLGLQLIPAKEEFDFLIVDHANRTPSEN